MGFVHFTTVLEIVQVVFGLIGVGLSSVALSRSIHTYRLITRLRIKNGRRIIAAAHVRGEALRLGAQMLIVMIGAISISLPPPELYMEYNLLVLIWAWKVGIVFLALLMLASTVGDAVDRRLLDEVTNHD